MQKVVQAAGRVIRTEQDVGTVHLIDDRYRRAKVRGLLPSWWQVGVAGAFARVPPLGQGQRVRAVKHIAGGQGVQHAHLDAGFFVIALGVDPGAALLAPGHANAPLAAAPAYGAQALLRRQIAHGLGQRRFGKQHMGGQRHQVGQCLRVGRQVGVQHRRHADLAGRR
ncbi:hypothetical protein G6F64_014021 [Rhizopus arrhizus]|uniref:ATP-dependent helicase C-terminal domain-containing protein n=1 Tax=Rhizopus oryzae TaxID=64495 RepID=A0A9P6WU84_RHIOR|nr:hypothetical protein G6F64_014021 [Rhizopus arrhizus]